MKNPIKLLLIFGSVFTIFMLVGCLVLIFLNSFFVPGVPNNSIQYRACQGIYVDVTESPTYVLNTYPESYEVSLKNLGTGNVVSEEKVKMDRSSNVGSVKIEIPKNEGRYEAKLTMKYHNTEKVSRTVFNIDKGTSQCSSEIE